MQLITHYFRVINAPCMNVGNIIMTETVIRAVANTSQKIIQESDNSSKDNYFSQFDDKDINPKLVKELKENELKGLKPIEEIM